MIETIRGSSRDRKLSKPRQIQWAGEAALVRLAHCINVVRREKKLSQRQLGEIAGVDQANISDIENADGNPTLRTVGRLAAALGVDVAELLLERHELEREMERPGVAGFIDGDMVVARYPAIARLTARRTARVQDDWFRQEALRGASVRPLGPRSDLLTESEEAIG